MYLSAREAFGYSVDYSQYSLLGRIFDIPVDKADYADENGLLL